MYIHSLTSSFIKSINKGPDTRKVNLYSGTYSTDYILSTNYVCISTNSCTPHKMRCHYTHFTDEETEALETPSFLKAHLVSGQVRSEPRLALLQGLSPP